MPSVVVSSSCIESLEHFSLRQRDLPVISISRQSSVRAEQGWAVLYCFASGVGQGGQSYAIQRVEVMV